MSSSNIFSRRLLPPATGATSVYETIREHEEAHTASANAHEPGQSIDERNLDERFQDQDLEGLLAEAAESQTTTESTAFLARQQAHPKTAERGRSIPRWMQKHQRGRNLDEDGDDVPESLLLEDQGADEPKPADRRTARTATSGLPEPVPGPSTRNSRVQWDNARTRQRLYEEPGPRPRKDIPPSMTASSYFYASEYEKAMWMWVNVDNLDKFLTEVYTYFVRKGIWSITLSRVLRLAQAAFVAGIGIFLTYCVDYPRIPLSKSLPEVIIPQCTKRMSFFPSLILWVLTGCWFWVLGETLLSLRRLRQLHGFYKHLLGISDEEIQTISWQEVVGRLMTLRDSNAKTTTRVSSTVRRFVGGDNSKERMDAHDIANRIMRQDNYLIALFNKDILDMSLPIPFLRNRQLYSRNLEWNINHALIGFFFKDEGEIYQYFLTGTDRKRAIEALRNRFIFYGFMNLIQAPFLVTYHLSIYFLRYFKEFQSNPSQLSSRAYTPMAEWKFREFNELSHFFRRRADMSFPFATRYLDQFPKDKTVQVSSFIAFVSGALLALLALASLLDPSNFLNFELSKDRTVLFYLGVLTVIWTVSKGIVPEENEVFDPEFAIQEVINYTHYSPAHWKGRLHSDEVRKEFSSLYQMKILIFLEEMMSIIVTPLVLWYSLPKCSDRIVDFFREFTVHVDGLGYVCSFALFEFQKGQAAGTSSKAPVQPSGEDGGLREDYYASNDNKMLASYYSFIDNYGTNPRKGPQRPGRQRFHPPPAFPGLATSSHARNPSQRKQANGRSPEVAFSVHRSQIEPSQSLLLDPNHQPPPAMSRRMQQLANPRSTHRLKESTLYEDDDEGQARGRGGSPSKPLSTTTVLEEDSRLGDSWKVTRAAAVDDDDEDEQGLGDDKVSGAGVLGMLYQFQKAQSGKGVGV